jgi:DNA-binding transcriptional regulator YiaG
MTARDYRAAREKLGLSNYALAPKLGIHLRTAQHYEAGTRPIPLAIARLLEAWVRHGMPKDI